MAYFTGSTTALGGNGTWTGNTRLRERHDVIWGTIFADQAGTLHIEQSTDGTNWDFDTTISVVASTGAKIEVNMVAPYWRLRYVNGATPQTLFRIQATTQAGGDS